MYCSEKCNKVVITIAHNDNANRRMYGNYKYNLINLISRNARHNRVCCIMKLLSQEK